MSGERVLVTGATGFLGSHLVHALTESGVDVTAVAADLGWRPVVRDLVAAGRVEHVAVPSLARAGPELAEALAVATAVVHLEHRVRAGGDVLRAVDFELDHNLRGTLRLLELVPPTVGHLCVASSTMVYGGAPPSPVSELDRLRPHTAYAIAKVATEGIVEAWARAAGIGASLLRFSTVYGPMETVPRAVPNFCRAVLAGAGPVIDGDGEDVRDYVHVADACRGTLLALRHRRPGATAYNIASGVGHTTNHVAARIIALAGSDAEPEHRGSRGEPVSIVCDVERAHRELGYRPQVDFEDGLAEELQWFAAHTEHVPAPVGR